MSKVESESNLEKNKKEKTESASKKKESAAEKAGPSGSVSQAEEGANPVGQGAPVTDSLPGLVSQDEIDALMSVYTSVNEEGTDKKERPVRIYDFTKPDKFSKDRMSVLSATHANFTGTLPAVLSSQYQVATRISMISLEQITYKEYLASIPAKTLLATINAEPLGEEIYLEVSPGIVGAWVDCLCGADTRKDAQQSELTPIDLAVVKRVISTCMKVYADAWSEVAQIKPTVTKIVNTETGSDSTLQQADMVVVCSLEIHVGKSLGMMSLCLPAAGLEAVLPSIGAALSSARNNSAACESVTKNLSPVNLPCKVVLGRAAVTMKDIMSLGVGDIIKTRNKANSDIELWVSGRRMFNCRPGEIGKNIAVVISGADIDSTIEIKEVEQPKPEEETTDIAA